MCGIAGFWDRAQGSAPEDLRRIGAGMAAALSHRGPDSGGVWTEPAAALALAHRRLAILDLSPAGHQPMLSADGRFAVSFNGEIYNHRELRAELEARGHVFATHSDSEVVLHAWEEHGPDCVRHLRGRSRTRVLRGAATVLDVTTWHDLRVRQGLSVTETRAVLMTILDPMLAAGS